MKQLFTRWALSISLLIVTAHSSFAFTTETLQVPSAAMKKDVPVVALLPDAYRSGTQSFPVLYLLHGAGGNAKSWARGTAIGELADFHGFIVICPDGGKTSWFLDSPIDPSYQYETFTSTELVEYIDGRYRTRASKQFRAIAGNSMGGHGALFLAIRHPEVFGVAVAMSGGFDLRAFPDRWDIKKRLGPIQENPKLWEELSVVTQAQNLKPSAIAISFECGVDDFFISNNRVLHQELLDAKIEHEYTERPGIHGWVYWKENLPYQMMFIARKFRQAEAAAGKNN